ncbi:MAG: hypothetical protein J4400_04515 [Candidatus Aenigmarchaeota archaeon]|nr:hypothetical protein [Candidatus Aenigmarchaeota archaeon]
MEIGFIGGFIILGAWIYEAYLSWKKGETPDIKFILAYVVGLSFLTYYTFQIKDMPLLFLNGAILSLTLLELDLALRQRHKKKNKRRQTRKSSANL